MTVTAPLSHPDTQLPVLKSKQHKETSRVKDTKDQNQPRRSWVWTTAKGAEEGAKSPNAPARAKAPTVSTTFHQLGSPSTPKAPSPYLAPKPKHERSSPSPFRTKAATRPPKLPAVEAAPDDDRMRREQGNPSGTTAHQTPRKADAQHSSGASAAAASMALLPRVYMTHAKTGTPPHRRSTGISPCAEDSQAVVMRPAWQSLSGTPESVWGPSKPAASHVPVAMSSRVLMTKSNPVLRASKTPPGFGEASGAKLRATPPPPLRLASSRHTGSLPLQPRGSEPGNLQQQQTCQEGGRFALLSQRSEVLTSWLTPAGVGRRSRKGPSAPTHPAPTSPGRPAVRPPMHSRRLSSPSSPSVARAPVDSSPPLVPQSFRRYRSVEEPDDLWVGAAASGDEAPPGRRFLGRSLAFRRRAEPEGEQHVHQGAAGWEMSSPEDSPGSSSEDEAPPGSRFLGRSLAFKRRAVPKEDQHGPGEGAAARETNCCEEQSSSSEDEAPPGNRFLGRTLAFRRRAEAEEEPVQGGPSGQNKSVCEGARGASFFEGQSSSFESEEQTSSSESEKESSTSESEELPGNRCLGRTLAFKRREESAQSRVGSARAESAQESYSEEWSSSEADDADLPDEELELSSESPSEAGDTEAPQPPDPMGGQGAGGSAPQRSAPASGQSTRSSPLAPAGEQGAGSSAPEPPSLADRQGACGSAPVAPPCGQGTGGSARQPPTPASRQGTGGSALQPPAPASRQGTGGSPLQPPAPASRQGTGGSAPQPFAPASRQGTGSSVPQPPAPASRQGTGGNAPQPPAPASRQGTGGNAPQPPTPASRQGTGGNAPQPPTPASRQGTGSTGSSTPDPLGGQGACSSVPQPPAPAGRQGAGTSTPAAPAPAGGQGAGESAPQPPAPAGGSGPEPPAPACSSALNDVTVDGVRILGRKYEMQSVLGEGSYGLVLKCRLADGSGRHVAVESFKVEDDHPDAESVRRTSRREVAMLRALQHPNVVGYEDAFHARGRLFIVMEHVPDTLLTLLEERPQGLERPVMRQLLRQLCGAMAFIHSKNAIYRDIKPENMLIDKDRTLKLCDFGFARFRNAPGEKLTDYVGTRWYRAPELLLGPPFRSGSETVQYMYGPATDMWAVGCIMAEMLTGEPLFPGSSEIEQLHLIQQLRGPLIPEHQALFDRNPHNAGAQLQAKEEAAASLVSKLGVDVSASELDFLTGLLCMDPERRLTGAQCLAHPYLARCGP